MAKKGPVTVEEYIESAAPEARLVSFSSQIAA